MVTRDDMEELLRHTQDVLRQELDSDDGRGLAMPGLEVLLVDLAAQIVAGIVAGLVSSVLLERWRTARTKNDTEKVLKEALAAKTASPVPTDETKAAIEASLVGEGLSREKAQAVATKVMKRSPERQRDV